MAIRAALSPSANETSVSRGSAGRSIFRVAAGEANVNVILETITQNGRHLAVAQRLRRVDAELPALVSAEDRALGVDEGDVGRRGHDKDSSALGHGDAPAGRQVVWGVRPKGGCVSGVRVAHGGVRGRPPSWHAVPRRDRDRGVTRIAPVRRPTGDAHGATR